MAWVHRWAVTRPMIPSHPSNDNTIKNRKFNVREYLQSKTDSYATMKHVAMAIGQKSGFNVTKMALR